MGAPSRNQPKTYVGNKQLHQRHCVMVEGGTIPRARVVDQTMFDRYLMHGVITGEQHRAAEKMYNAAAAAGYFPKGQRWGSGGGRPIPKSTPNLRSGRFGDMRASIREHLGPEHEKVTVALVCHNLDLSGETGALRKAVRSLEFLSDRCIPRRRDPLEMVRSARKKGPA